MCKVIIEKTVVNGEVFSTGEFFDEIKVYPPSKEEPYWEVNLLKNGKNQLN